MQEAQTMEKRLLAQLRRKWTSPLDALREVGCLSLAQRVSEWRRDGLDISDKWVTLGNGKRIKSYRIQG